MIVSATSKNALTTAERRSGKNARTPTPAGISWALLSEPPP
jgi:hypothetical protein